VEDMLDALALVQAEKVLLVGEVSILSSSRA
jgi:hypothetical protein